MRRTAAISLLALPLALLGEACTVLGGDGSDLDIQYSATAVVLHPEADTYVRSGQYSSQAYGTQSTVEADRSDSGTVKQGYMRFAVANQGSIASATLRLYVKGGSSSSADLIATSDTGWTENMTWDTRAAPDGALLAVIERSDKGTWIALDVTSHVVPGQPLAFALVPRSSDGFDVASREDSSRAPELALEMAGGEEPGPDAGTEPDPEDPLPPSSASECLNRSSITVLSGTYREGVDIRSPPDGHAVDARTALSLTSGERALEIGSSRVSDGLCVVGWTTVGQQSRTLSWRTMHDDVGGSALRVYGSNYVVDGLRADNVEDGFDPRSGEGFELRNAWMSYVRDDCIENDELSEGRVVDSLFDGCYTFFSEQEDGSGVGESLVFDHALVRLQPLPAPRGTEDPTILGHGSFFKKFHYEGRHQPIIRDSIFFLEEDCYSGCSDWPAGTQASNVTVVWVGAGGFPMSLLPGMTLTTDRSVWDSAVARWKERHGCTSIDQPCSKLHTPDPY